MAKNLILSRGQDFAPFFLYIKNRKYCCLPINIMNDKRDRAVNWTFAIVAVILLAYSAGYIFKNSYVVEDLRYYSLFDDEMISMRYADNLANGEGLVWNPDGERVEGFSNPLWVYVMSAVHLFPIPKAKTSLVIQIFCFLLLIVNLYFIKRSVETLSERSSVQVSAVVLGGLYLPLINWALQGVEIILLAAITTAAFYINIRSLKSGNFNSWQIVLPGIMIWVRMDALLIFVCFAAFLYFYDKKNRRKILAVSLATLAFFLGALFIWRQVYFGEWLPNTYFLKMSGYSLLHRITKGGYALLKFIIYLTPIIFALPFWFYYKSRRRVLLLPLSIFVVLIAYSVWVGGDSWEWWMPANRFISTAMPLFIIVLTLSLGKIASIIKRMRYLPAFFLLSLASLVCLNYNSWEYLTGELLLDRTFTKKDNLYNTRLALASKKILKKDATAAVVTAGVLPYFWERNCVDILGKNDKAIALMLARKEEGGLLSYNPGHMKWNYSYSIGKLKPDAVLQLWENRDKAVNIMKGDYVRVDLGFENIWLRKNSKQIKWDETKRLYQIRNNIAP